MCHDATPYRAGGGTAVEIAAVCRPTQRRTVSGSKPALQPETSESYIHHD